MLVELVTRRKGMAGWIILNNSANHVRELIFGLVFTENILLLATWYITSQRHLHVTIVTLIAAGVLSFALSAGIMIIASRFVMEPLQALWHVILHLSPTEHGTAAPNIQQVRFGRELVTSLAAQVYQFTDIADKAAAEARQQNNDLSHNFLAQNMPLPLFVLDAAENITFANEAAGIYLGLHVADMIGKNVYFVLDMSFPNEDTFDTWLKGVKVKTAIASSNWERVRLSVRDNHPELLFDLAAYYNRDNPNHNETMLVMFDHTKMYSQDEQAVSFIALSVHELRTPLTLLRGYIEVFEDEIDTSSSPELRGFMEKMRSQAEQLMAFVNNILNVARVDDDQLELRLEEAAWPDVLKTAIQALSLRAKVRDITLHCRIDPNLPTVGVDRLSVTEVINNLVDNAIKYSNGSKLIEIETHLNAEGLVETSVQDFGLGIGTSVIPNLFTKFYRDYHNRAQVGGTGLGLYLSKAIITAHGGTVSIQSKEGEGSTFSFTLVPFAKLADDAKKTGGENMLRGAHGWIKNHSLYRR